MASFPNSIRFDIEYSKETIERAQKRQRKVIDAARGRRRLYHHISHYPVSLLDEITRNGTITVAEREELNSYLYGR